MTIKIERYKPAVMNSMLLLMAGIVWDLVGIMLIVLAFSWLLSAPGINIYFFAGMGVVLALLSHHLGFLRIVDSNLKRILGTNDKKCLFSFIPLRSYIVIAVMVSLGFLLRHSVIPKKYLAILYIGIGLALMLSSVRYMRFFFREFRSERIQ